MEKGSDDSQSDGQLNQNFEEHPPQPSPTKEVTFQEDHFIVSPSKKRKRKPVRQFHSETDVRRPSQPNWGEKSYPSAQNWAEHSYNNQPPSEYCMEGSYSGPTQNWEGFRDLTPPNREGYNHPQQMGADSGSDSDGPPPGVRYFMPISHKVGNSSRAADHMYASAPDLRKASTSAAPPEMQKPRTYTKQQRYRQTQKENNKNSRKQLKGNNNNDVKPPKGDVYIDDAYKLRMTPKKARELASTVEKRAQHNQQERLRRDKMTIGFNSLKESIPASPGERMSRADILKNTTKYFIKMKERLARHEKQCEKMRKENEELRETIRLVELYCGCAKEQGYKDEENKDENGSLPGLESESLQHAPLGRLTPESSEEGGGNRGQSSPAYMSDETMDAADR